MSLKKISTQFLSIPKSIRTFGIKALILFIVWQTIYSFLLLPNRIIDKPLSLFTANATASTLNIMGNDSIVVKQEWQKDVIEGTTLAYEKAVLYKGAKRIMGIADGCNGLGLFVLFVGFIIAFPASLKSKIMYAVVGLILIVVVNILRTTGLAILILHHSKFTPFAHHYLYKLITYALVFGIWVHFTKHQQKNKITNA